MTLNIQNTDLTLYKTCELHAMLKRVHSSEKKIIAELNNRMASGDILMRIGQAIEAETGIMVTDRRRTGKIPMARKVIMSYLYHRHKASLVSIGANFGGIDHASVLHHVRTARDLESIQDASYMTLKEQILPIIERVIHER